MNIYSIVMKKTAFFKHSNEIVAKSVRIVDGHVYFKTDGITKKYLDDNKISYKLEDSLKNNNYSLYYNNNDELIIIITPLIGEGMTSTFIYSNNEWKEYNDEISGTLW